VKINKKITITGTHHTPAIELIRILESDQKITWNFEYISHLFPAEQHLKNTIIPKGNINFHDLECGKFDRNNLKTTLIGIPKTIISIFKAILILHKTKPDIVVSFGGYVSVPVIIAAYFLKIPSLTHEQTLTISLSTKINSYFTNFVALSFANKEKNPKYLTTGNLLRQEINNLNSPKYQPLNHIISSKPLIYITGGNQGSAFINELIFQIIDKLEKYTVLHQTGNSVDPARIIKIKQKYDYYHPTDFVKKEDIGWAINKSEIIISRAGANICQEIVALNKKSILIPLPNTQQNEQGKNAKWVASKLPNSTIISQQQDATPEKILRMIIKLTAVPIQKNVKINNQTHPLVDVIYKIIQTS